MALFELLEPPADFGLRVAAGTNTVTSTKPGSTAGKAGMAAGDELLQYQMKPRDYATAVGLIQPKAGSAISISVQRGIAQRNLRLVAAPIVPRFPHDAFVLAAVLQAFTMIVLATFLALMRPSWMTYGFFAFSLGSPIAALPSAAPATLVPIWTIYLTLCFAAGVSGMLIFFACFPHDNPQSGWQWWLVRAAIIIGTVLVAAFPNGLFSAGTFRGLQLPGQGTLSSQIIIGLLFIAGAGAFGINYYRAPPSDRQRLGWVAAAIVASLAVVAMSFGTYAISNSTLEYLLLATASVLSLATPVSIAYAILHYRVVDVRFAFSRGLIYTALSGAIVTAFAAFDWLIGSLVSTARWALPIEIAAAIGTGVWLNSAHDRFMRLADQILFHRRHDAERRLSRVTTGLHYAESADEINDALTMEPYESLELTSASVFRRADEMRLIRERAAGWPAGAIDEIPLDSRLCLHVRGEGGPLRLRGMSLPGGPAGEAMPLLALPLLVRHRLEGIVFYGGHRNGGDFDTDEIQVLERLARAAAGAYDHLSAEKAQETIAVLQAQLRAAQGLAQSHQGGSAS